MVGWVFVISVLATTPVPAKVKLASSSFQAVNVSPEIAAFCSQNFAEQLATRGLSVITEREVSALLGLERQKQLLGCDADSSSCVAELANALGVDGMIFGDVVKLGTTYQLNIKIVRAANGERIAGKTTRVSREEDLLDAMTDAANELAPAIRVAFGQAPANIEAVQTTRSTAGGPKLKLWVPVGVGVVLAGVGTAFLFQAKERHDQLTDHRRQAVEPGTEQQVADDLGRFQTLGFVGIGLGAAAIATGVGLTVLGGDADSGAQVWIAPGAASVAVGGVF